MRSLIILEVEYGEDTDLLAEWVENIGPVPMAYPELTITNYTVRVDVPPCFVLDSPYSEGDYLTAKILNDNKE